MHFERREGKRYNIKRLILSSSQYLTKLSFESKAVRSHLDLYSGINMCCRRCLPYELMPFSKKKYALLDHTNPELIGVMKLNSIVPLVPYLPFPPWKKLKVMSDPKNDIGVCIFRLLQPADSQSALHAKQIPM